MVWSTGELTQMSWPTNQSSGTLANKFQYFGPFPAKIAEIADPETLRSVMLIMQNIPKENTTPFLRNTESEVNQRDNIYVSKMMKLDWRDRPTAKELLEDEWWNNDTD